MSVFFPTYPSQTGLAHIGVRLLRHSVMAAVLLFSLTRCGGDPVVNRFDEIILQIDHGQPYAVFSMLDASSEEYFDKLVESVRSGDPEAAEYAGQLRGIPIMSLLLYERLTVDVDSLEQFGEYVEQSSTGTELRSMLDMLLMVNRIGVFRHSRELPIKREEGTTINGDISPLRVTVPTGKGARLESTYLFAKEEDRWNLNYPSTLKAVESIHRQAQRKSGLDPYQYAKQVVTTSGGPIQFEYRL